MTQLYLNEKPFVSLSGEAGFFQQGSVCTFIRFQGCNLRCLYCDTPQAQNLTDGNGIACSVEGLVNQCRTKQVLITGGEPLMQPTMLGLIRELIDHGHVVQVETNGSLVIPCTLDRIGTYWVVDRKGPSSGQVELLPIGELFYFYAWDIEQVIFKYIWAGVLSPYHTEDWSFIIEDMARLTKAGYTGKFIISPMDAGVSGVGGVLNFPEEFRDRVIISLQIHKILNIA